MDLFFELSCIEFGREAAESRNEQVEPSESGDERALERVSGPFLLDGRGLMASQRPVRSPLPSLS